MFQDMAQYQSLELGNPRGFWEYKDEEFVAWVTKLTGSYCGTRPWHLGVESDSETKTDASVCVSLATKPPIYL